jgi:hypothetical protein
MPAGRSLALLTAALLSVTSVAPAVALEVAVSLRDEAGAPLTVAVGDSTVRLLIEARDPVSGWPPSEPPRAWLVPARGPEEPCALRAARLVQRGADPLRERPLDGYRLLVFGPEGELAFLDPRLRLASAHLHAVLKLPATPRRALLDTRRAVVWAALPEEGLLRIDVAGKGRVERLSTGAAVQAAALLADGRLATASADGRLVIREPSGSPRATLELPAPATVLAWDPLAGRLWLGGPSGLALVEPGSGGSPARRSLAEDPVRGLVLLPRSRLVLALVGRTVASFDADETLLLARTPFEAGADTLVASADERIVFAPDRAAGVVSLLDATTGRLIAALALEDGLEEIGIGSATAYLAPSNSGRIALLPVAGVEPGRLPPLARLVAGTAPRGPAHGLPRLAPTPDGRAMLVLAPGERRVFLHGEGAMLAPSSALPIPFADARGLVVQPLGLSPIGPGRFELATALPPGVAELVLLFTEPPEAHCVRLPVEDGDGPAGGAGRPALRLHPPASPPKAATPTRFLLEIDRPTGEAVRPEFLAASTRTGWFARPAARQLEPTRFEVEVTFPEPGPYALLVRVPDLGLDYLQGPSLEIAVGETR